jgi:hypothetical protein
MKPGCHDNTQIISRSISSGEGSTHSEAKQKNSGGFGFPTDSSLLARVNPKHFFK